MNANDKCAARNAIKHTNSGLNGRDIKALGRITSDSADDRILRGRAISALSKAASSRGLSGSERSAYNSLRRK